MANLTELLNSREHDVKQYNEFLQDLLVCNSDIPFPVEEIAAVEESIISKINARINQVNTRHDGLIILDNYLPKCSKDTLAKYSILWIAKATQVLENIHSNQQSLKIACKVIGTLVAKCKAIPELHKQISMQNVKQLLNVLNNLDTHVRSDASYYLIAVLLYHYPEVCERHQVLIKKMILHQLDATEENLVQAAAKCHTLLIRAIERTFKPPSIKSTYTCWIYNQALICNSLHSIMDDLFSDLIELESVDIWDRLELPSISEKNVTDYYFGQKQRFSNLCIYLCTMLRGHEEKNSVSPDDVLRVLCRGLAIKPSNLRKQNSFKEQMLYLILPKLHLALFSVLSALIEGFKHELIPFGSTILQLLHQTLQWTGNIVENQTTINNSKPFKNERISAYKCLSLWLICTNSLSGIETIIEECFPYILRDIIPERNHVTLTMQNVQNLSKKALKRFRNSQYEKGLSLGSSVLKKNALLDADLCLEALVTLQNIFFSGNGWLKQTFYKDVQNIVIPMLYNFYLGVSEESFYRNNAQCRVELLKVLKSLQLNPHSLRVPPTQYSVEIFEMALNDTDLNIIHEARLTLAELEKVVHPVEPTLYLSKEKENENGICAPDIDKEKRSIEESTLNENFVLPANKKVKIIDSVTLHSN